MTELQRKMCEKLIHKFGFEDHRVVNFCWMCEREAEAAKNESNKKAMKLFVELMHENVEED
jgi:hypothetical protein